MQLARRIDRRRAAAHLAELERERQVRLLHVGRRRQHLAARLAGLDARLHERDFANVARAQTLLVHGDEPLQAGLGHLLALVDHALGHRVDVSVAGVAAQGAQEVLEAGLRARQVVARGLDARAALAAELDRLLQRQLAHRRRVRARDVDGGDAGRQLRVGKDARDGDLRFGDRDAGFLRREIEVAATDGRQVVAEAEPRRRRRAIGEGDAAKSDNRREDDEEGRALHAS
ncbi:MAG TPA: hypothetical protein VIA18_00550 [Polyangia bacterium]|nr:hypothetical protein [Polyangia bacterium]